MKRIISLLLAVIVIAMSSSCGPTSGIGLGRKDVIFSLNEIATDAAMKQFKKARKHNQSEILSELLRQANEVYEGCQTIEDVYRLKERLDIVARYIASGKQSFMSAQFALNTLSTKVNNTIREYEGGTTVYNRSDIRGYWDFGQELD